MLQHVEWTAALILSDPFRHAVADAKWRVTTIRQRMAKLQTQLDEAVAEEKKVMAAAKEFMESGKVSDDFFPDLSTPTRKIRKEYLDQLTWSNGQSLDPEQPNSDEAIRLFADAKKIVAALKAAGITDWFLAQANMDGFHQRIELIRDAGADVVVRVGSDAIKNALHDSIKAYYAAWDESSDADPRERAERCARAALKVFYEFDGSEFPEDLPLHEGNLYHPEIFKRVVAHDHGKYLVPLRPRGQHISPFQVRVDGSGYDSIDDFGFGPRNIDWEEVEKRLRKKMLERNSDWEEVDGRLRKKMTEGDGKRSGNGHDPPPH